MVRVKYRYILAEIMTEKHKKLFKLPLDERDLKRAILKTITELHGDYGLACIYAGFSIKTFNPVTRIVIFRVRRKYHKIFCVSLPLLTTAGKMKLILRNLHVSGTIRSAFKFLVNYDRVKLCRMVQDLKLSDDKKSELEAFIESCHSRLAKKRLDAK